MTSIKLLHVAVVVVLLLLGQTRTAVEACTCDDSSVCETFVNADVVLRGKVILASAKRRCVGRRCKGSPKGSIVYIMEIIDLFKGEPGNNNGQEITFYTEDGDDACRALLEEGDEYLLDLIQTDGGLLASSCGLVEEWDSVRAEIRGAVEDGCEVDKCEAACDEFQECLLHGEDQYFCADVCDPSPCAEDEVCSFQQTTCLQGPCPQPAVCTVSFP